MKNFVITFRDVLMALTLMAAGLLYILGLNFLGSVSLMASGGICLLYLVKEDPELLRQMVREGRASVEKEIGDSIGRQKKGALNDIAKAQDRAVEEVHNAIPPADVPKPKKPARKRRS